MFKKNEIEIGFNEFVYNKHLQKICEVYPIIPAKKIKNSWWKKMKSHYDVFLHPRKDFKFSTATAKYCPGLVDFTNYGYIVPAWQDFDFWVNDAGEIEWQVPPIMENVQNIKIHPKEQVDACPILDNIESGVTSMLKLLSPWYISTPKGTSMVMQKPFYHHSVDFDICPGVVDSDIDTYSTKVINIFFRLNVKNKVIRIKAGDPLLQLIPFKRTNWKLKQANKTMDKDFKTMYEVGLINGTRFGTGSPDGQMESMKKYRHGNTNKKFE